MRSLLAGSLALLVLLLAAAPVAADPPADPPRQAAEPCIYCHVRQSPDVRFPSGETLTAHVDPMAYGSSVHAAALSCSDCHVPQSTYPHLPVKATTRREYTLGYATVCGRCHFENYTKTLDSVHQEALLAGKDTGTENPRDAPVCTDCHGAHDIGRPGQQAALMASRCGTCHQEQYSKYQQSVHGAAITEEGNPDVPSCTSCHGVHNIVRAESPSFRLRSVDVCGSCHGDAELMRKYGISTNVFNSYLDDFHGKTFSFYKSESSRVWLDTAVCTDCHGTHDIRPVDDPNSPAFKDNLRQTCGRCHPGATPNFPGAWLSHYQPGLDRAPVVFSVRWFYRLLIPGMIGGLALHILLDVWRLARNR